MMTATKTTLTRRQHELLAEIEALSATEYLVATNDGTYGSLEARNAVGCGDPEFATRRIYETVGGRVRSTGPSHARAPGRIRHLSQADLAAGRARLAELRAELRATR